MFREKDMGNLLQRLFTCGDYFRDKEIELVTDSQFGHMVPTVYLRLFKVYVSFSFNQGPRVKRWNFKHSRILMENVYHEGIEKFETRKASAPEGGRSIS